MKRDDSKKSKWLNKTVLGAGITSSLGDFCYETTTVILPGFLAVLGIPAAMLGVIEGAADALASFTKMVSGYIADRLGCRKALVLLGYALTPLGQILIALAGGWFLILSGRLVSWFGKGLRGPLRDAIVIGAVLPENRGRAFGFHRAADTIGAVVGPLLGVALLGYAQDLPLAHPSDAFRWVLWLSVIPGVLAVLSFAYWVSDPQATPNPSLRFFRGLKELPARFKRYLGAVALFGVGDFSHTLLILAATTALSDSLGWVKAAQVAGLLYVWRNIVQVLCSYPIGVAADLWGHGRVLIVGYALGGVTAFLSALAFLSPSLGWPFWGVVFALAGVYMGIQDTLEATVSAEMVESHTLNLSYGALGTVNGIAKFVSSATVGGVWSLLSPQAAFGMAAFWMIAGTLAMIKVQGALHR